MNFTTLQYVTLPTGLLEKECFKLEYTMETFSENRLMQMISVKLQIVKI